MKTNKSFGWGVAVTLVLVACMCGCSMDTFSGGSGGETGNPFIMGMIVDTSGHSVPQVKISVLNSRYNPVEKYGTADSLSDTTDAEGGFAIKVHQSDTFTIQATHLSSRQSALMTGIAVRDRNISVPDIVIKNPGAIRVLLSAGLDTANGYIYVPGTTIFSQVTNSESVLLYPVPAGTVPSIYYAVRNSPAALQLIKDSVVVVSGDTTTVSYYAWKSSKKIFLNTTASGANVGGNVTGFPVAVRLTSTYFDFSSARRNGEDIRFAKSNGMPLPYEIERWDSADGVAEIWVKVDTVYGNSNSRYFMMFWGVSTSLVTSASNGAVVFDTLNGFQGVWHMNEAAGQAAKDATANHFDGTPSATALSVIPGTIGLAQEFNGVSNYIQMRGTASGKLNFSEPDTFTVSAWVYVDTLVDSTSHLIAGKGHQQYYLKLFFGPQGQHWEFTEFLGGTVWQITAYAPPVAKSWKFLFGMRQGNTQFLYLDGALVNANTSTGYPNAIKDTSNDFTIGRYLQYVTESNQGLAFFNGAIDEVRISNVSRSADWIRLEYMNQKANSALVEFR